MAAIYEGRWGYAVMSISIAAPAKTRFVVQADLKFTVDTRILIRRYLSVTICILRGSGQDTARAYGVQDGITNLRAESNRSEGLDSRPLGREPLHHYVAL